MHRSTAHKQVGGWRGRVAGGTSQGQQPMPVCFRIRRVSNCYQVIQIVWVFNWNCSCTDQEHIKVGGGGGGRGGEGGVGSSKASESRAATHALIVSFRIKRIFNCYQVIPVVWVFNWNCSCTDQQHIKGSRGMGAGGWGVGGSAGMGQWKQQGQWVKGSNPCLNFLQDGEGLVLALALALGARGCRAPPPPASSGCCPPPPCASPDRCAPTAHTHGQRVSCENNNKDNTLTGVQWKTAKTMHL